MAAASPERSSGIATPFPPKVVAHWIAHTNAAKSAVASVYVASLGFLAWKNPAVMRSMDMGNNVKKITETM